MAKKKLGKLPEQDTELLALITPGDVDAAKAAASIHGSARFVKLLEAKRRDETTEQEQE